MDRNCIKFMHRNNMNEKTRPLNDRIVCFIGSLAKQQNSLVQTKLWCYGRCGKLFSITGRSVIIIIGSPSSWPSNIHVTYVFSHKDLISFQKHSLATAHTVWGFILIIVLTDIILCSAVCIDWAITWQSKHSHNFMWSISFYNHDVVK